MNIDLSPEAVSALADLGRLTPEAESPDEILQRIVSASLDVFPTCEAASITISVDGEFTTPTSTDEVALTLDKAQYDSMDGPCVEAARDGATHVLDEIANDDRWPEFRKSATAHGVISSMSVPLSGEVVGGLNFYGKEQGGFDQTSLMVGRLFASHAGVAISNANLHMAARKLVGQLEEAVESRDVIGAAKGILMEREGISSDQAFNMLRIASQNSNIKLRDVAAAVVSDHDKEGESSGADTPG
jgi:GAF domain-containing protein